MKLYATNIPKVLPDWATVMSKKSGLFEIEINAEDPQFQSVVEKIATELEPGLIGVKARDLCKSLSIEMIS